MYTIVIHFPADNIIAYANSYNEMRRIVQGYTDSNFETMIVIKEKSKYDVNNRG